MTDGIPSEDSVICARFAQGHEDALQHVQGWVEGVIHLGRWNFEDPQGVAQESLIKLLRVVRTGRFNARSSFKTFVFSVAKHTCIDTYRHERLRRRIESPQEDVPEPSDTAADPEARLADAQRREILSYIFQRLPEECRSLWNWVYSEGLPAARVSEKLGITPGHARVRVHRCLEKARSIGRDFLAGGPAMEPRP